MSSSGNITVDESTPAMRTAADVSQVPANYRKGGRRTWHQLRRRRAVLGMLRGVPGKLLDYGCGYGDLAEAMSSGREVCGVDLDAVRVAYAQQEYAPIEFAQCTTTDAPYPDESFDVITSIVVLNFIPDATVHLRSIRRMLRPGGHVLLACKNHPRVQDAVRRVAGRGPLKRHPCTRTPAEIRELLDSQGFDIVRQGQFYDPPFTSWKNVGDVVVGGVEQLLSIFRVHETAGYFLYLAKKRG
jgi:2-polyprenyl-3-methyl-5-hydroxy-6-metoxy-1,4-benzoquinol methylase